MKACLLHVWSHVYRRFKACLHHVWGHVYTICEVLFTSCLKICSHNVWSHVDTIFEIMFTQCLSSYLYHVYTLFKIISTKCLHSIGSYVYTVLEEMFTSYMKTSLRFVGIHLWRHDYIMFADIPSLKICLQYVWRHVYTMLDYTCVLKGSKCFKWSIMIPNWTNEYKMIHHTYTVFTRYLKSYLHNVYTVYKVMFTLC